MPLTGNASRVARANRLKSPANYGDLQTCPMYRLVQLDHGALREPDPQIREAAHEVIRGTGSVEDVQVLLHSGWYRHTADIRFLPEEMGRDILTDAMRCTAAGDPNRWQRQQEAWVQPINPMSRGSTVGDIVMEDREKYLSVWVSENETSAGFEWRIYHQLDPFVVPTLACELDAEMTPTP